MKRLRTCLAVATLAASAHAAEPTALDLALASADTAVTNQAGRTFRGRLDGFREGRLHLLAAREGGEVGYSFAPGEIATLVLPGADTEARAMELLDRGRPEEALPLLEALGRQRARYLPLLDAAQRRPLLALVEATGTTGAPLDALGYARLLLPHAATANERGLLRDAELTAYVRLGMLGEARALARRWCAEADPGGPSALGWSLLARLAYEEGDFPGALWIALQPVAFSTFLPTEHLDASYAYAVAAAHRLENTAKARQLFLEMRDRGLAWPPEPLLAPIGRLYSADGDAPLPASSPADESRPADPTAAPPAPAPADPLGRARKLVAPPFP